MIFLNLCKSVLGECLAWKLATTVTLLGLGIRDSMTCYAEESLGPAELLEDKVQSTISSCCGGVV